MNQSITPFDGYERPECTEKDCTRRLMSPSKAPSGRCGMCEQKHQARSRATILLETIPVGEHTTGEIKSFYEEEHGSISLRSIRRYAKKLVEQGKLTSKKVYKSGHTTVWRKK